MKILLSGAGGFLGSHLLQLLAQQGTTVAALTSKKEVLQNQYAAYPNVHVCTMEELRSGDVCFGDDTVLINCAFPRNADGGKMASGLQYVQSLLETAVDKGVSAVINISSQSVYSQTREHPADEQEPLNLESSYAVGKYAAELLVNAICRDIQHTNLRMASLIGSGFDQRVVNKLIKRALNGEPLTLKVGDQKFGFLDVRDAASAILRVAERSDLQWDTVYNLGTAEAPTLSEIGAIVKDVVEDMTGKPVSVREEPAEATHNSALDPSLFQSAFHWSPSFTVRDTASEICRRLLEQEV